MSRSPRTALFRATHPWATVLPWLLALLSLTGCGGHDDGDAASARQAGGRLQAADLTLDPTTAWINTDQLLDWAEMVYPQLFAPHQATQALSTGGVDYAVRHYAASGNYTGVAADGGVWGYGPFTGMQLQSFGRIEDFNCLVVPDNCTPVTPSCTHVTSGFNGNLNALYDAGGDGSADGDDGSAGVGGSEGKVLGARLRVWRLADGALLGQGMTDVVQGLATVRWCKQDLPVVLELQGAPGARYFDEAVNDYVDFPVGQTLHTLVDRFDENIGVSAMTEAAYQYALAQYTAAPAAARAAALDAALAGPPSFVALARGVPVGLTALQVRAANARMLREMNRRFTDRLQQRSIKALATPIDANSTDAALPRNRYGTLAALTGAFAKVARSYDPDAAAPALAFSGQLARDMTDGLLDGHAADGSPVATAGKATYRVADGGLDWTLGLGVLNQRFGRTTTLADADAYVDVVSVWLGYDSRCANGQGEVRQGNYTLSTIGTVTFSDYRAPAGGCIWDAGTTFTHQVNFLTGVRSIVGLALADRAFAITQTGDVMGWGWNRCGRVGNGRLDDSISDQPSKIPGLSRVIDIVPTLGINIALTATGDVYTWGPNVNGLLGHVAAADDPTCTDLLRGMPPSTAAPVRVIVTPRRMPGLSQITAISGSSRFVNVVRADGRVFQWGYTRDDQGRLLLQATPVELKAVGPVRKVVSNEQMSFAIIAGGKVATWWVDAQDIFEGEVAANLKPPQVLRNVSDVVDLASDPLGVTLALRTDGGLYLWGRWSGANGTVATGPRDGAGFAVRRGGQRVAGGLPRIVRLTVTANYATAIGADNDSYVFRPGATLAESYWDATPRFTGLPQPF